jgi:hypothetical protein
MLRAAIFLFCLLTIPLRANLGETVAQCVARYGKPVGYSEAHAQFPFGTVAFTAGSYTLIIFLMDTTEVGARVSKVDKSAFTDDEIKTILNADSATAPWISTTSDDPTCLKWGRNDKATVLYDKKNHVLIFTSEKMANAFHGPAAKPVSPANGSAPVDAGKTSP